MPKILDDITSNKVSLDVALQRLLVIANKTDNKDLANWCTSELNGYKGEAEIPEYRRFKSRNIIYSGFKDGIKVQNAPLGLGYISEEYLSKVQHIKIVEGIEKVQEYASKNETLSIDLTFLAPDVYNNTNDGDGGIQCTSIKNIIPANFYSQVLSCVKTRVINLICSYETAGINVDKFDIKPKKLQTISRDNYDLYKTIVLDGTTYAITPKEKKITWNIIIPILVGIVSGVAASLIAHFIIQACLSH